LEKSEGKIMKTMNEQIANKCIHFNGLMNKVCDAGVKYKDVEVKDARPIKIPCLKDSLLSGGTCLKSEYPSEEDVKKQIEEIQKEGQKTMTAYKAIKDNIEKTGEMHGKIECPSCGGNLHYNSASLNGHIWAKCKCGLGWME